MLWLVLRVEDIPFLQNLIWNKILRHWSGHWQQRPLYFCKILDFGLKIQCTFIKLIYKQEVIFYLNVYGYGEFSSSSLFPFLVKTEKTDSRAHKLPYMITLTFRLFPWMNFIWICFSHCVINLVNGYNKASFRKCINGQWSPNIWLNIPLDASFVSLIWLFVFTIGFHISIHPSPFCSVYFALA